MSIYTGEIIESPDGIRCAVLDTSKIDFANAALARKTLQTLIINATGGEKIQTRTQKGKAEGIPYFAEKGDAIFVNLDNAADTYIPGSNDGNRWKFSELKNRGYVPSKIQTDPRGTLFENPDAFRVIPRAVKKPSVIKDAWGNGKHQFLFEGASLKLNHNGSVTGIDEFAFKNTWTIL
jgi:hypothetical protein